MSVDKRDIVEAVFPVFLETFQQMILDGWRISKDNTGELLLYGNAMVTMERSEDTVKALRDASEATGVAPKMSVTERLAKARAAKEAKKEQATLSTEII